MTAQQAAESFGRRAAKHREAARLSLREVAEAMTEQGHQWHATTVVRTESAQRPVRLDEAVTLAAILGMPVLDERTLSGKRDAEMGRLRGHIKRERTFTKMAERHALEADAGRAEAEAATARAEARYAGLNAHHLRAIADHRSAIDALTERAEKAEAIARGEGQ